MKLFNLKKIMLSTFDNQESKFLKALIKNKRKDHNVYTFLNEKIETYFTAVDNEHYAVILINNNIYEYLHGKRGVFVTTREVIRVRTAENANIFEDTFQYEINNTLDSNNKEILGFNLGEIFLSSPEDIHKNSHGQSLEKIFLEWEHDFKMHSNPDFFEVEQKKEDKAKVSEKIEQMQKNLKLQRIAKRKAVQERYKKYHKGI